MSLDVNLSEPDEFNCIELHSAIKKVSEIVDINDFNYHVDYLNGYGYIANIFRVILTENGSEKSVSVIVKTLINTARKELFRELHNREVKAYVNVIEKFRLIQNEIDSDKRVVLPKYIYLSNDKGNEVLILEDLLVEGFEVNETLSMNLKLKFEQVSSIIAELAKFHGLSHALHCKENNFNEISNSFHDILFQESFLDKSKLKNYFDESFEMSLNVIDNMDIKDQLETLKPKLLRMLQKFLKPKKCNVFCHGDFWINNILFKKEKQSQSLCFLDFQAMRYANPATDIIYFLYICTDSQFRSEHFDQLINVYYDSMKSFLLLFNIEANKVYPYGDFVQDLHDNKKLGLLIALIELRIVAFVPDHKTSRDLMASELDLTKLPDDDNIFQTKINDVITESINNGVINDLLNMASEI